MNLYDQTSRAELLSAFGIPEVTSYEMQKAISEWFDLYYRKEIRGEEDPCQRISYTVVSKLSKTCFSEYKANISNSDDSFCSGIVSSIDKVKKRAIQMTLIGGESWIKPFPYKNGFKFSVVRKDNVLIFGRDEDGIPTDIGTQEVTSQGRHFYTLLERRTVDSSGFLTISNKLYESDSRLTLGHRVSLSSISKYSSLPDTYTYPEPIGNIGMAYIRVPSENTVDGSLDGCSIYSPAVGLIHNIDHNEWLLNSEFDNGRSRIFVSDDLMRRDKRGKKQFSGSLFTGLDGDPEDIGVHIFNPDLREQSFLARKTEYLRNVENIIGLKRGLLSEVEASERTAKEITSSEGDYSLSIIDLQEMWADAFKEVCRLCGIFGRLYHIPGSHDIDEKCISLDFGNGVLYDEKKTWADYLDLVARGLLKPEIVVGWYFGLPIETEDDLKKIREKYMPAIDGLAVGEGDD